MTPDGLRSRCAEQAEAAAREVGGGDEVGGTFVPAALELQDDIGRGRRGNVNADDPQVGGVIVRVGAGQELVQVRKPVAVGIRDRVGIRAGEQGILPGIGEPVVVAVDGERHEGMDTDVVEPGRVAAALDDAETGHAIDVGAVHRERFGNDIAHGVGDVAGGKERPGVAAVVELDREARPDAGGQRAGADRPLGD